MFSEFKKFALKGNVIDMAVGIIIGAAFATVVKSMVDDILMPVVAALFNAPDFSNLFIVLRNPSDLVFTSLEAARQAGAVALAYGVFLNNVISFLIVAFALFVLVRNMNKLLDDKAKNASTPSAPPSPTAQEVLLADIRDILKERSA